MDARIHLRYAEAGYGEAGDEIPLEVVEGVAPAPVEHREHVLQAETAPSGLARLLLVVPQRVVAGEQHVLHRAVEKSSSKLFSGGKSTL